MSTRRVGHQSNVLRREWMPCLSLSLNPNVASVGRIPSRKYDYFQTEEEVALERHRHHRRIQEIRMQQIAENLPFNLQIVVKPDGFEEEIPLNLQIQDLQFYFHDDNYRVSDAVLRGSIDKDENGNIPLGIYNDFSYIGFLKYVKTAEVDTVERLDVTKIDERGEYNTLGLPIVRLGANAEQKRMFDAHLQWAYEIEFYFESESELESDSDSE